MTKVTANQVFLRGMRYLFLYSLTCLSALFILSVGMTDKEILLKNFILGYSVIVITAFVISFVSVLWAVKQVISSGELDDENIFKKDGVLNINFLRKQ